MSWRKKNIITISIFVFLLSWNPQGAFPFQFSNTSFAQSKSPSEAVSETTEPKKGFFGKLIDWAKGDSTPDPEGDQETPPSKKEGFFGSITSKIGNFFGGKKEEPVTEEMTKSQNQTSLIPPEKQTEVITDLLTCPSGNLVLEPLAPTTRQSWWPAFLSLVKAAAKELAANPKDNEISRQPGQPAGKSVFAQRLNAGTLPRPGNFGWKWDESSQQLEMLNYRCPVFTGVGDENSFWGRLDRNGLQVTHPEPRRLFSSNYVVTIESQNDGTRLIQMTPTSVRIFSGTESGGRGSTPDHGSRSMSDKEVCTNGSCVTGRIREIQCTCKLNPQKYPYQDNSILFSADDPCGLKPLFSPSDAKWSQPLDMTEFPSGILFQLKDSQGQIISRCDAIDGPVNPHEIEALNCGNYEAHLVESFQRINPPHAPSVPPPPRKGPRPDATFDPSHFPAPSQQCPPGGSPGPDRMADIINQIVSEANNDPVPDDVIRVKEGTQVNITAIPEGKHVFDIYEKGRSAPYGDLALYDMAIVPTLQAISIHLAHDMARGLYNPIPPDPTQGVQGTSALHARPPSYPKPLLDALYYLDRITKEINSGSLKIAWADLSKLGSFHYYHAPTRTIILDKSLKSAATPIVSQHTPYTDDPDIKTLPNVGAFIPFLIHSAIHDSMLEDDLTIRSPHVPPNPAPPVSLMDLLGSEAYAYVPPNSTPVGGWTPVTDEESPCKGGYWKVDRSRCEFKTAYLDAETCEPQMTGGNNETEILAREGLIRFIELLATHYLPEVKDTKLKLMCSLGDLIATCNSRQGPDQTTGVESCRRHDPGGPTNGVPCIKDVNRAESQNLVICPDWANNIPDHNRTWVECTDPRGPEICRYLQAGGGFNYCTVDGVSQYPPCHLDNGFLYDPNGQLARSWNCGRSTPSHPLSTCRNPSCQMLSSQGTCNFNDLDFSHLGFVSGLVCDPGSGGLLGAGGPPLGAPVSGNVIGFRPENYYTLAQGVRNFLLQSRADDAVALAAWTINYRDVIPPISHRISYNPMPDIRENDHPN